MNKKIDVGVVIPSTGFMQKLQSLFIGLKLAFLGVGTVWSWWSVAALFLEIQEDTSGFHPLWSAAFFTSELILSVKRFIEGGKND